MFYIMLTKFIYIIFLLILLKTLIKISILIFKYIITNNKDIIYNNIKLYKKALLCITLIFLNDLFIFYCGNNLLHLISFLT